MGLEDVKKQVLLLHEAVMTLDFQDQIEAIDFINDCFSDLRLKSLSYEDLSGEVLNLSTIKKNSILNEPDDNFVNFRFQSFYDAHNFDDVGNDADFGGFEPVPTESLIPPESYRKRPADITSEIEESGTETAGPVNLVMPAKQRSPSPSVKKSRRKQMFTRKSVRRISGNKSESQSELLATENDLGGVPCPGCRKNFKKSDLQTHIKSHEPTSLSCRVCRLSFSSLFIFWRHKEDKRCRLKESLVCPECGDKFKFESHYLKHLKGHRDNNCKFCTAKFSSRSQCREHMKKVHPEIKIDKDLIPCKFCPMSFPRLHRLYNHYRLHHSKGKFVCTICGLFLSTKEKHKEHILIHENEKKWKCALCSKKFYSKNMLSNHTKIHESGKYKCLTCNLSIASKAELMNHKRDKHEVQGLEPTFKCDVCKHLFSKKSALQRHMSIHSDEKLYNCKDCVKGFSTLDGLTKHLKLKSHFNKAKLVAPESKYEKVYEDKLVCENCGKQYKTYSLLKHHLRTHKGIFKCVLCNKSFTVKVNLVRHLKNHDKVPMAVCELCGDSFSTISGLREHTLIKHSNDRPARCDICDKTFKRNSELNRHKRIHGNERPYSCFCGRNYKQVAHLRSHEKSAHSKNLVAEPQIQPDDSRRPVMIDRCRIKDYSNDHGNLLSLDNFEEQDYRLQDSFKVPYVPDDYGQHMHYGDLPFGASQSVSPAVDLSMVAIPDVDAGLAKAEVKPDNLQPEPNSTIPFADLNEHMVQEYLLNLH